MFGLSCCTPSQRLARLVKKHPELLHSDTLKQVVTFTLAGIDTSAHIALDTNTNAIREKLTRLRAQIDSIRQLNIDSARVAFLLDSVAQYTSVYLSRYYSNKTVLLDTLTIRTPLGDFVKVWQQGAKLVARLYEAPKTNSLLVPVKVDNTYKDIPWRLPWYWFVVVLFAGVFSTLFIVRNKNSKAG